jgi:hypothetical protein
MAESLSRNQGTTVIGAGGMVAGGAAYGGTLEPDTTPCPNCQRPVALADNFCRKCGHNMQQRS